MPDASTFETKLEEALGRYADRAPQAVDSRDLVAVIAADPTRPIRSWSLRLARPSLGLAVLLLLLALAIVGVAIGAAGRILRQDSQLVVAPTPSTSPEVHAHASADPSAGRSVSMVATDSMLSPRSGFATALLADGRVLVIGGAAPGAARPTELWDPSTGHFTVTDSSSTQRESPLAVPLADGRVLVAGGQDVASAEIFNSSTGKFTPTGSMQSPRNICHCGVAFLDVTRAVGVLLDDGRVFVAGGNATAEVFDPTTGVFTRTPPIPCDASRSALARLADGQVMIICLSSDGLHGMAVLYDPTVDRYALTGEPTAANTGAASVLPDGHVLVTGAARRAGASHADLYDPSTGTFMGVDAYVDPSPNDAAVALLDGRVLFLGQGGEPSWTFDSTSSSFSRIPATALSVVGVPTLLSNRRILIIDELGSAAILDPAGLR